MLKHQGVRVFILEGPGKPYQVISDACRSRNTQAIIVHGGGKICIHVEVSKHFDWDRGNALSVELYLSSKTPLVPAFIVMPPTPKELSIDLNTFNVWSEDEMCWAEAQFQFENIENKPRDYKSSQPWWNHGGLITVRVKRLFLSHRESPVLHERLKFDPVQPGSDFDTGRPGLAHTIKISDIKFSEKLGEDMFDRNPLNGRSGSGMNFHFLFGSSDSQNLVDQLAMTSDAEFKAEDESASIYKGLDGYRPRAYNLRPLKDIDYYRCWPQKIISSEPPGKPIKSHVVEVKDDSNKVAPKSHKKGHLSDDFDTTTDELVFSNNPCGYKADNKADNKADLKEHYHKHHSDDQLHKCKVCGRPFRHAGHLRLHERAHEKSHARNSSSASSSASDVIILKSKPARNKAPTTNKKKRGILQVQTDGRSKMEHKRRTTDIRSSPYKTPERAQAPPSPLTVTKGSSPFLRTDFSPTRKCAPTVARISGLPTPRSPASPFQSPAAIPSLQLSHDIGSAACEDEYNVLQEREEHIDAQIQKLLAEKKARIEAKQKILDSLREDLEQAD